MMVKIKKWIAHRFGQCEDHDLGYCTHCYEKLNSIVHIHNWNDKTKIKEDRSCGCEVGTYCGDEISIKEGESYCGEYIGEYSSLSSWTWQHWVDEEYTSKPYCKQCYKKWKLDPSNFKEDKK